MEEIPEKLLEAVEFGKVDKRSPFPPRLKGQDGSHELTIHAIQKGNKPKQIFENAGVSAQQEGITIALEQIEIIKKKQVVNGIHIMTFGGESIVERLISEAGPGKPLTN